MLPIQEMKGGVCVCVGGWEGQFSEIQSYWCGSMAEDSSESDSNLLSLAVLALFGGGLLLLSDDPPSSCTRELGSSLARSLLESDTSE